MTRGKRYGAGGHDFLQGRRIPPDRPNRRRVASRAAGTFISAVAMAGAGAANAETAAAVCPQPQPQSNLVATLVSDFAEKRGDMDAWRPKSGPHIGGEAVEAEVYDPAQVAVVPGQGLRLSTVPGSAGMPYRSGWVETRGRFAQRYGRFEVSAKLPQQNGMWPAIWLLPASNTWPPEIDILEYIYAENGVLPAANAHTGEPWVASNLATTLHWRNAGGKILQVAPMLGSPIVPARVYQNWGITGQPKGFHVYAVDWRKGSVTWIVDGKPLFCVKDTAATGPRVPDGEMFPIINTAVAKGSKDHPGWAGYVDAHAVWPQTMDVRYVHVYRFKDTDP